MFLLSYFLGQIKAGDIPQRRIEVHAPVMIKQDGTYYLSTTSRGINGWSSDDMQVMRQVETSDIHPVMGYRKMAGTE